MGVEGTISEAWKRLEEDVMRISEKLEKVIERQRVIDELQKNQEELLKAVLDLKTRQEAFQGAISDSAIATSKMEDTVLIIKNNIDRLSEATENISQFLTYQTLLGWLKEKGLSATKLIPLPIVVEGVHEEIRFYGTVRDAEDKELKIYANVKTNVRQKDVTEFAWVTKAAEKLYGEGKKVLIGFKVYGDAYQEAQKEGIEIVEASSFTS